MIKIFTNAIIYIYKKNKNNFNQNWKDKGK